VIAGVAYFLTRPQKREAEMALPAGTVYYKGPLKGKGGQSGNDELNPDLPDTSKQH